MPAMRLLKGTLDILVLKTLSWSAKHGVEIITWLEERSDGQLAVDDGALYQALHRLEERGMVGADWGTTANNRRARYYRLTPAGRSHLRTESTGLMDYAQTLLTILGSRPGHG
jgi:transcriptional regulator